MSPGTVLLLVDVENLHKKLLTSIKALLTDQTLRYRKVAFGNWKQLGNLDQEYIKGGFLCIQTLTGKNSADHALIEFCFLEIQKNLYTDIIICSSDSDFDPLRKFLVSQGFKVHQIKKEANNLVITQSTPDLSTHRFFPSPLVCSQLCSQQNQWEKWFLVNLNITQSRKKNEAEFIFKLQEAINSLARGKVSITPERVFSKFMNLYNTPITKALKELKINQNPVAFLESSGLLNNDIYPKNASLNL